MSLPLATSTWDDEEYAAIQRVIDSDRFSMGPEVETFEKQFAEFFGTNTSAPSTGVDQLTTPLSCFPREHY